MIEPIAPGASAPPETPTHRLADEFLRADLLAAGCPPGPRKSAARAQADRIAAAIASRVRPGTALVRSRCVLIPGDIDGRVGIRVFPLADLDREAERDRIDSLAEAADRVAGGLPIEPEELQLLMEEAEAREEDYPSLWQPPWEDRP